MNQLNIESTLNNKLNEYAIAKSMDIAYTNTGYTPIEKTPYIAVDFLLAESFAASIGTNSKNRCPGIYQLTLNVDSGEGKAKVLEIINDLSVYFKRGNEIIYNGVKVRITKSYLGSYQETKSWFRQVLNIAFRSDIEN